MRLHSYALLLGLGFAFGGCALHSGGSGTSPSLQFDNCSSDCGLDENGVAAGGARTAILVNGGIRFSSARSTNPTVATFTADGNGKVDVWSGDAGTADLQLLDAAGHVVFTATVTVVPTATLRPNRGWNGDAPLVLAGEVLAYHVTTLGADGKITKGDGSVDFTLGGPLAPAVAVIDGDAIAFSGSAAGPGTIDAHCPNTSLVQPINVVAAADITTLNITGQVEPSDQAVVTVVPQSAGGPVYTGGCAWSVSDPSVTLETDVTPRLDLGAGEVAVFNLNRPGTYTVGCTVAGQTASVVVSR
jgi:hypothetical protein